MNHRAAARPQKKKALNIIGMCGYSPALCKQRHFDPWVTAPDAPDSPRKTHAWNTSAAGGHPQCLRGVQESGDLTVQKKSVDLFQTKR